MDPLFQVHMLNENGRAKAKAIANEFDSLLINLKNICPENTREFAIVKTNLEQACFFAKKAIANDPGNQIWPSP